LGLGRRRRRGTLLGHVRRRAGASDGGGPEAPRTAVAAGGDAGRGGGGAGSGEGEGDERCCRGGRARGRHASFFCVWGGDVAAVATLAGVGTTTTVLVFV
jgi:hypothetical protein